MHSTMGVCRKEWVSTLTPRSCSIFTTLRWPPVRMPRLEVSTRLHAPRLLSHTARARPKPPTPPVMMYDRSDLSELNLMNKKWAQGYVGTPTKRRQTEWHGMHMKKKAID